MLGFLEDRFSIELAKANLRARVRRPFVRSLVIFRTLVSGDGSFTKRRRRKRLSFSSQAVRESGQSSQGVQVRLVSLVRLSQF